MEETEDALEAEIARLEAELGQQAQPTSLGQFLSTNQVSSSALSYDEVTIDTAEFTAAVQQPVKSQLSFASQNRMVSVQEHEALNEEKQRNVVSNSSSFANHHKASCGVSSHQQRPQSTKADTAPNDEEDEATRIQREIEEMEAAVAAASSSPAPPQERRKKTKKVRKVRKKASHRSTASSQQPDEEEDTLQRQIAEMEAEITAQSAPQQTKALPFLAQLSQTKQSNDDEHAIENIGTKVERKEWPKPATEQTAEEEPPRPPNPFATAGLLSAISKSAEDREQRLANGEEKRMTVVTAPEPPRSGPQLSTSLAEMISARATARDERLANGGEKRITAKPKEELKRTFSNIVTEAASMGRLTRLDEHVVEGVAVEKTPEQEWKSNGLLAIQWRSNHMAVIHEAARVGNEVKMPEKVVSGKPDRIDEDDDGLLDAFAAKPISERKRQLLEASSTIGEGQAKVDKLIMYRKEEQPAEHLLVKPMTAYSSIDEIQLPKEAPPKVDPVQNAAKLNKFKREMLESGRPMVDISNLVAERAWERRARLDRPGAMPKMVEKCDCPYCQTASPYQTFAYREMFKHRHEIAAKKEAERLEMERKREERRRQREERRRLEQEVAAAEAAIAAAKAAEEEPEQLEQAPQVANHEVVPPPEATPCCACTIM